MRDFSMRRRTRDTSRRSSTGAVPRATRPLSAALPLSATLPLSAALILALALVAGCSGPVELRPGGTPRPTIISMGELDRRGHAVVGSMVLCLTAPGSVEVTAVTPVNPAGPITVVAYALRFHFGPLIGSAYGDLASVGVQPDHIVDAPCVESSGEGYELVLELATAPATNASADGWLITYTTAGASRQTSFPLGVLLCATAPAGEPVCTRT